MTLPRFIDLQRLADRLASDARYNRLATLIKKAALAQSCIADIAQALTLVDALKGLLESPRKRGTMERAATENAMLFQAIIMYARSTANVGQQGERGSISIHSNLDPSQLADHNSLVAIRNRVVAHVYTGEHIRDDVWHKQALYLVELDNGWRPASAVQRVQLSREVLDRLQRQLPVAHRLLLARFHQHMMKVTDLINLNGVEMADWETCPFDPIEFFGSEKAVWQTLATSDRGGGAGLV